MQTNTIKGKTRLRRGDLRSTLYAIGCLLAAFVFAIIVTAGATTWVPPGRAGVDHIVVPAVFFPVVWIIFVFRNFSLIDKTKGS